MAEVDFIQQLMEFRTTYLRGVSRATVDLEFRRKLTDGRDPLKVLAEAFGYECPWFLKLVLHDKADRGPRLNPANGAVMTLPYYGESITVSIPRKPAGGPKVQMDALAAYYHENPWFLRKSALGADRIAGIVLPDVLTPPPIAQPKWTSVAMDTDRNTRFDLGDNFDDFISFAAAIFNAVALAWDNELFLNDLTAYQAQSDQARRTTIQVLDEWLGYAYPWELDLMVQIDERASYDVKTGTWVDTTPPVLMLTLPWMTGAAAGKPGEPPLPTPAEVEVAANNLHPSVAILGVALYNTDGPGYPFTCG